MCVCMTAKSLQLSLWLFVACQASRYKGFSRQEYWSEFPCPIPGDLSDQGTKPASLTSPALAGEFYTTSTTWEALSSVQFSCSVMSDSWQPHERSTPGPLCPSPTPGVYSNLCPSSRWCHPAISSSVTPFFSCSQSLPASGSFPMSQLFTWGGQNTGVSASASVLPMNTQDGSRSPLFRQGWATVGLMTRLSTRGIREASYLKGHLWKW